MVFFYLLGAANLIVFAWTMTFEWNRAEQTRILIVLNSIGGAIGLVGLASMG